MKKCVFLFLVAAYIVCSISLVTAQQICSNQTGTNGGYWYTFWTDGGGSVCMTMGSGGQFSVQWSNCGNFVCGKGWSTGSERTITWSGSSNGAQYVGVYGWMQNPLVEYYIPRSGGTNKGTYSADGTTYTLYTNQRINQPSIEGTKTFTQYFCGGGGGQSVNFGQHLAGWRSLGMGVGSQNYQVVAVEGWGGSSGSSSITVGGGTNPTATPTRTATMTPTGTLAPTPTPNQNPIWTGGPYTLTGTSSSYIDIPDGITNNLSDISIACWVNLNALANWTRIFDFGGDTNVFMMLTPSSGNTGYPYFCITTSGNNGEQGINGTSAFPTGSWQHLAVVKSGNTGILYINNQEVGRNTGITLRPADLGNTTNNYIGRSQWSNDPYLNASIDHFVIYNRSISVSEVSALFSDRPDGNVTLGDVNGSGSIDIVDALMIAQYCVGLNPQEFIADNADVNCDGSITIVDALMTAQYSVGLIPRFSC